MPEPLESKREQGASTPEVAREAIDVKKLGADAESVMKKLGYQSLHDSSGRPPSDFKPTGKDGERARSSIVSEKKDEMQVFQDVSAELKALLKKQSESSLTFAEIIQYHRDRLITRTALMRGARQHREGDTSPPSTKEFDESLISELTEFDDEVIYDYLITIQKYSEYAAKVSPALRDPQMQLWEKLAQDEISRLETAADLYVRIENISIATLDGTKVDNSELKEIPQTLSLLTSIFGVQENGKNVLKVKVWNELGKQPRVIEKSIVLDEDLFTSPARENDLNLVKDFCRQLMRASAGKGVNYSLGVSDTINEEIKEAYKPKTMRERFAKIVAKIIVGTPAQDYKKDLTNVRMPHAMYGKLLTNHVGDIQAKGVPKFDPKNLERIPLDLAQLRELQTALKALSEAHEENTLYTLSNVLNQTMDLMTPGTETLPLVQKDKAARLDAFGKLKRDELPAEVRQGITVDQPSENIAAMGNFLTILQDGFTVQLNSVSQAEKNIDNFMDDRLVKAMELLNDWKIPLMKIFQYAPPNYILSKYWPELKGSTGAEELVIQLRTELDAVRKKNEGLKQGIAVMKDALKKAIADMQEQKVKLQALATERRALLSQLNSATTDDQRRPILALLETNAKSAAAMREPLESAQRALSRSFIEATDSSARILGESQIADSFYTSRDKVGMTAFVTSAVLFTEWATTGGVSLTIGKGINLASSLNPVSGAFTKGISPGVKALLWQPWRRAILSPVLISDARALYSKLREGNTAATVASEAAQVVRPAVEVAEAANEGITALRGTAEVQNRVRSILETPEFAQVMKARGLKSEQMAEVILRNIDDVDSLIAIEQSQMGRRMLLGAAIGGEAEVARIFSAAKAARVLMTTLNVVGVVGDAFGLAMACVDYQENSKKLTQTKNPVLREFYESARPIIIARGAVSGGLLIGGTLVLFAQGAAWMGPVGLVMAAAALGAEGVRQTMNAKEEVLKYYAMDEKDLLSQSTEGQMLEWVGKTDPVMRSRLNWYHSVLPDEQVQDMNINARRNGYRSYFLRTAAETVPHANILDVSQESFIKALSDKSPGTVRSVLEQETKFKVARFVADAVSFVSEQTKGMYTLVSSDVLSKAVLFAKANERLRVSGKPLEPDSSSVAREVFMESLNDRNASAKEIEAMEKVSDNTLDFTRLLLAPLRHDLAVLDQKILTSDLSDDMKASVRGWYAEELWTVLQRLYVDSKQNWKDPRSLDAIQSNLQNILSTQPSSVATKIKKSDQLPVLRGIGQNPSRLSLGGIIDHVNTYRFVKPTHLGLEGRALPLSNLNFYSMTGKGKKAVLKVPQGKDVGWVSSDIPMYQVASYESSPMYNIPQDGHPAYFFLKKGVTYSFWSEDKKTQYVIKAE